MDKLILNEDTIENKVKEAVKVLDNPEVVSNSGDIENALDRALRVNLRNRNANIREFENILFVGVTGTGKTARIEAWANAHRINLVPIQASVMDDTDLGGAISPSGDNKTVIRLASTEFDELASVPNSVLFLDEFNRANDNVRGTLLTLINNHTIRDDRVPGKVRYLPNFLFTVAAINPADSNYNTRQLDDAEKARFKEVDVTPDPLNLLKYLTTILNREINSPTIDDESKKEAAGQLSIATALLNNRKFIFDSQEDIDASKESGNGLVLSHRTFTNCLLYSDGTKEDFLKNWNSFCNSLKYSMVDRLLKEYKDVDDKANSVFKSAANSTSRTHSSYDNLQNLISNLK